MIEGSHFDLYEAFSKNHHLLLEGKWGLEKESLRTTIDGKLSNSPHPEKFGDKIKNRRITTDFSESQIEMITPALGSIEKTHRYLEELQDYIEKNIGDEFLWRFSMPCILGEDDIIPIAQFDDSPAGRTAEIYRNGLAYRYGKRMQLVSGIHYNFSFSERFWNFIHDLSAPRSDRREFINESYMAVARNYLRYRWLLIYLFGASPAADDSFMKPEIKDFEKYATSIRMSPLGYSSGKDENAHTYESFDSLDDYIKGLEKMLGTDNAEYEKLGLFKDGKQIQLNYRILQKENEFYSPVRLKSGRPKNESNLDGLKSGGACYLEIRSIDLDPFYRTSISKNQMRFIHSFLLYCLFETSGFINEREKLIIADNDMKTALLGRKEGLGLTSSSGEPVGLREWSSHLLDGISKIAKLIDLNDTGGRFYKSVLEQHEKNDHPELLPSSRIIDAMHKKNVGFASYGRLILSRSYREKKIYR
jgi:glutamate--cysteine ligase